MTAALPWARPVLAVLAAAAVCAPRAARASDGESALSVFAGFATYSVPPADPQDPDDEGVRPSGGALGLDYEREFSRSLSWRLSGGGGVYYAGGLAYSGHATLGLTYRFDVLKYVPYANLGVGGIVTAGAGQDARAAPLVEVGLGLDVLRSRERSWGVQVRFESLLQSTFFFTAGARMTWRWGYF